MALDFTQHSSIQGPLMRPFHDLENKILSDIYCRDQLVCMKVQAHSFFFKSEPTAFDESGLVMIF